MAVYIGICNIRNYRCSLFVTVLVANMRAVLSKIESLKEEYEKLDDDWYDDFDNWGNTYDEN